MPYRTFYVNANIRLSSSLFCDSWVRVGLVARPCFVKQALLLMIAGQYRAGGGSDHDPLGGGADTLPECAAGGGDGRVALS
jgi:hypothetical protein